MAACFMSCSRRWVTNGSAPPMAARCGVPHDTCGARHLKRRARPVGLRVALCHVALRGAPR